MSDFSNDIRDAFSGAAVEILTELGETVTYSNRGSASVTLYAAVDDITKTIGDNIGIQIESSEANFTLARTLNSSGTVIFPPTNGVSNGDEITFGSIIYTITDFSFDSTGAIFDLRCDRRQARRVI